MLGYGARGCCRASDGWVCFSAACSWGGAPEVCVGPQDSVGSRLVGPQLVQGVAGCCRGDNIVSAAVDKHA